MSFLLAKPRLALLGRIIATLSLLVILLGKTVHLHQECGCCSGVCGAAVEQASASTCEFGCAHHSHEGEIPAESPTPQHDEHQCAVCSVLAQAPQGVSVPEAPDCSEFVVDTITLCSDDGVAIELLPACSRGPPAV